MWESTVPQRSLHILLTSYVGSIRTFAAMYRSVLGPILTPRLAPAVVFLCPLAQIRKTPVHFGKLLVPFLQPGVDFLCRHVADLCLFARGCTD
jgi:hypothetical protein